MSAPGRLTKLTTAVTRTRRRRILLGIGLVVVIAAVLLWVVRGAGAEPAPRLATASVGTVREEISAVGTIAPGQRADLSFGVSGRVTAVNAAVGQQVPAGTVLATVDAASLPSQVAQAEASVASARARLSADQSAGASSAQLNADRAALDAALAQQAVAERSLSQASLTAPFPGTVAAVNITVGEQVSAGSGASPAASPSDPSGGGAGSAQAGSAAAAGAAHIVVISTDGYVVNTSADDTQVGSVKVGDAVQIVPNGTTAPIPGTVSSVALVATQSEGVASYPVTITVTGAPDGLHVGASAQVSIIVRQLDNVLLVPSGAVRYQGGSASVVVLEGGQQVTKQVTVGVSSGGQTQIVSGLDAGAQVVLPAAPTTTPSRGGFGPPGGGPPPSAPQPSVTGGR